MSSTPGERADPTPGPGGREPTPAELAAQQGVPARGASHYAKGTAANMVRSMAVILALTLGLFFVTSETSTVEPDSYDVASVAEKRAPQAGHVLSYAKDLPEGWVATSARYVNSSGDVVMWSAGYTTPDEEHVAVQQALDPPEEWVEAMVEHGAKSGSVEAGGRTWAKRESADGTQRSLVHDPADPSKVTTLVTGTATWEQLETFADHLVEVRPEDGSPVSPSSASPAQAEGS